MEEIRNIDEEEEEEEEVVEEEGKPQYKTIIGKQQNPNILTIMADRNKGYPIVRFTAKGGNPVDYDMRIKRDRELFRGLIHTPMKGSVWSVLRKEVAKTGEIQKRKKQGVVTHLALQHHLMTKMSRQRSAQPKMRRGSKVVEKKRQRKPMFRRLSQVVVVLTANPQLQKPPLQRRQPQKCRAEHLLERSQRKQLEHARLQRKRWERQRKLLLLLTKVRLLLWTGTTMMMTLLTWITWRMQLKPWQSHSRTRG